MDHRILCCNHTILYGFSKQPPRKQEPWVLEALGYLHHPLRAESPEKYILPSLEMLEEIKSTRDIFSPGNWITSTLTGHHSPAAKATVENFLSSHPHYPDDLRLKILQAGDQLLRNGTRGEKQNSEPDKRTLKRE